MPTLLGYSPCPECDAFGKARCPFCVSGRSTSPCPGCDGRGWLT